MLGLCSGLCSPEGTICREQNACKGNCHTRRSEENIFGNITDVPGIKVGVATDQNAATGCTVMIMEDGAVGGVSVQGGAPGSRETDLLSPFCRVEEVHGIALSGGSAFGLDTASGVMRYLEEKQCGLPVGPYRIPIVPAAILFDLFIGTGNVRPDAEWGYQAASNAVAGEFPQGSAGAGTGATVAKSLGMHGAVKAGQASLSRELPGGLIVGVLVVVNALGDVWDTRGALLAGPRDPESGQMRTTLDIFSAGEAVIERGRAPEDIDLPGDSGGGMNTTLGVVATNAALSKVEVNRVAALAHNGLARTIKPLHTGWDGDTVFALANPRGKTALVDVVAAVGAELMAEAVPLALYRAVSLSGVPALKDLKL